ncbi:MAG: GGDEF domain-containing protein [Gammaproteobacteria bacterium]|nr:MAG: GGDEF domain-containing protein [Gammaproteobacteria bacterium]
MSLYKQLWLAVIILLALVFGASFVVGTLAANGYLEQQLGMGNTGYALALVFLIAMIAAGCLGSYLLKIILQPLNDVIEQAQAIGDRRFITIAEPSTREFKQVASAMNSLSERIKQMLKQEAKRLEKWQHEAHIDKVTGLMNRESFMGTLDAALHSDDVNSTGSLILIRLASLAQLNQTYGRKAIDSMLADIGHALNCIVIQHSRWAASRLNGSDFVLLAPRAMEPAVPACEAQQAIQEILENRSMHSDVRLPGAATLFTHGETISELLIRLDGSLLNAAQEGESRINVANRGDIQLTTVREQMARWRVIFEQAFHGHKFSLASHPAIDKAGKLLHLEAPVRMELKGDLISAGQFLPWINRLELSGELDRHVVDLALRMIEKEGRPTCINLSVAAVVETSFLPWLSDRLSTHAEAASHLWMEVSESMALRHLTNFKHLCTRVKQHQCKIGIEHMGHQLSELGQLHDVGVDYLKVDSNFVRDIDNNVANQTLLRNLCTVGHSIGVIVIGEGVRTAGEWATLKDVGMDGATGPGVNLPNAAEFMKNPPIR